MNKHIRKTVTFLTAAALLAAPVYTSAELFKADNVSAEYTIEAGDAIIIEIGDVTGEAGSKVKVPVYAKNVGRGFSALQFSYNMESSFRVTRGLKGDFGCNWTIGKVEPSVQFLEADGMNISGDGSIGRLEIEIPSDAVNGTYEISISGFEGSAVNPDDNKQYSLDGSSFTGVSGHITVTGGREQGASPSAESTVTPEASPSAQAEKSPEASPSPSVKESPSVKPSPSPSAKESPSVKPSPSPSAKTSPSAKSSPSAGNSSSPDTNTSSAPSAKASASPDSKNSPSSDSSASPDAKASQSAEEKSSEKDVTSAGNEKDAEVTGGAAESEDELIITDADGKEVVMEIGETANDEDEKKSSSKKIEIAAIAGALVAVALVLVLIFRRP